MFAHSLKTIAPVTPLSLRLTPGVPPRPPLQSAATPRAARRRPVRQPFVTLLAVLTLVGGLRATAWAQSSGNFAADLDTEACTINTATGALTQHQLSTLTTTIQTPNASQTTLLIRPSLVTGLYTNTQLSKNATTTISSSSAMAAVVVHVTLDGHPVAPDLGHGVIYDARFQQVSSNVFDQIAACATLTTAPGCFSDLLLSTLSAHSMDFVAPAVGQGTHTLQVTTELACFVNGSPVVCTSAFTPNSAGACSGPGTLTVTQVKAFNQSGGITF